jgi:DNA-directed RNA polymerase subunit K/omega
MSTNTTLFEQVIILAQRTRELRDQRYGSIETGMYSPATNIRMARTVDVAIDEVDNKVIGREYLTLALNRTRERRRSRPSSLIRRPR